MREVADSVVGRMHALKLEILKKQKNKEKSWERHALIVHCNFGKRVRFDCRHPNNPPNQGHRTTKEEHACRRLLIDFPVRMLCETSQDATDKREADRRNDQSAYLQANGTHDGV